MYVHRIPLPSFGNRVARVIAHRLDACTRTKSFDDGQGGSISGLECQPSASCCVAGRSERRPNPFVSSGNRTTLRRAFLEERVSSALCSLSQDVSCRYLLFDKREQLLT